jgi:hypothetical protein
MASTTVSKNLRAFSIQGKKITKREKIISQSNIKRNSENKCTIIRAVHEFLNKNYENQNSPTEQNEVIKCSGCGHPCSGCLFYGQYISNYHKQCFLDTQ